MKCVVSFTCSKWFVNWLLAFPTEPLRCKKVPVVEINSFIEILKTKFPSHQSVQRLRKRNILSTPRKCRNLHGKWSDALCKTVQNQLHKMHGTEFPEQMTRPLCVQKFYKHMQVNIKLTQVFHCIAAIKRANRKVH